MASYITVEQADDLVGELFISSDDEYKIWNDLSSIDKQVLLNRASSKLVGENFLWHGKKVESTQELDFPRIYKGKVIEFDKQMSIGLLSMIFREQVANNSEYSELRKEGIKKLADGGGMSIELDSGINSSAIQVSGLNSGGVSGIPKDIFSKYFKPKSHLV